MVRQDVQSVFLRSKGIKCIKVRFFLLTSILHCALEISLGAIPRGFESHPLRHVGASFISLAPTFFKSQSALMPLLLLSKSQPLALGCDLILGTSLKAAASIPLRCSTSEQAFSRLLRLFLRNTVAPMVYFLLYWNKQPVIVPAVRKEQEG